MLEKLINYFKKETAPEEVTPIKIEMPTPPPELPQVPPLTVHNIPEFFFQTERAKYRVNYVFTKEGVVLFYFNLKIDILKDGGYAPLLSETVSFCSDISPSDLLPNILRYAEIPIKEYEKSLDNYEKLNGKVFEIDSDYLR